MIMKLGMEHYVLKLYKVYVNDDPELTLTYFTIHVMSNLAKLDFVLIVGPDIRSALTGPMVLWLFSCFSLHRHFCSGLFLQTAELDYARTMGSCLHGQFHDNLFS